EDLKTKFLSKYCPPARTAKKMEEINNFQTRSTKTYDRLAAIQAQLNNLGREIKKVNEKVYAAQVGCKECKGPHYTKDFPLNEEVRAGGQYLRRNFVLRSSLVVIEPDGLLLSQRLAAP
nr:hypothetical protein [Tanacetum cinerariifolium]